MNQSRYQVLDDVGLSFKKQEIEDCLKLRFKNTDPKCILTVDCLFYIISAKLQIIVYQIHIIHSKQYLLLSDLLRLLSNLDNYLDTCTKRLLIEEGKVRDKLDELSTKKLRTKNTVKTSEQLSLSKDLQKVVHVKYILYIFFKYFSMIFANVRIYGYLQDDYEGLKEMRQATHETLDKIITDRVNTLDIKSSVKFFAKKIQKIFPSEHCVTNNGNYQQFIYNNIQYTSELALMLQDCATFLNHNDELKVIIQKNNILQQYQTKINDKHTLTANGDNKTNGNGNDINHHQLINSDSTDSLILFFDSTEDINKNANNTNSEIKEDEKKSNEDKGDDIKILDLTTEFSKINDEINDTVREMNKYCSTLQELFQLKTKLGKQLIKFVKYHWK